MSRHVERLTLAFAMRWLAYTETEGTPLSIATEMASVAYGRLQEHLATYRRQ